VVRVPTHRAPTHPGEMLRRRNDAVKSLAEDYVDRPQPLAAALAALMRRNWHGNVAWRYRQWL